MKGLFHRIFCLYSGEGKNASLFVCLAFLWALGAYCGLTLADGLFIEQVGTDFLPHAYLLTAISLFAVSTIFLYLFHRFTPLSIYLAVLTLAAGGYGLFFLTGQQENLSLTYWFSFKVFANVLFIILTTCFWFFIDQYYHLQNAKRLYTLFNSAIFLGNATGAGLLSLCLNTFGRSALLLAIALLLAGTIAAIIYIARQVKPSQQDGEEEVVSTEKTGFKPLIKNILLSRFTLFLIITYLVFQLLNIVTEYSYMEGMERHFRSLEAATDLALDNKITVFLGKCMAWIALGNMLFGLFFYSRVVSRLGVNNTLIISPLFFLAIFTGWSFSSALFFSVMGLVAVEGVSYLIDENNSNLLLNAIPSSFKNKIRIAIDSFFEPLGMLISSLIFLLWNPNATYLGLALAIVSLTVALLLRSHYRQAVLVTLSRSAIDFQCKTSGWISRLGKKERKEAEYHLISILRKRDESEQIMAFEALLQFRQARILPRLLNHLSGMSFKGKLRAIKMLDQSAFSLDTQVLDRLHHLAREMTHPALKGAIHFYFAKYGLLSPEKIAADLKSPDLTLRAAAILALKKSSALFSISVPSYETHETRSLKKTKGLPKENDGWIDWIERLQKNWASQSAAYIAFLRLESANLLHQLLHSADPRETAIALQILGLEKTAQNVDTLLPFLSHPVPDIQRKAAEALALTCDPSCSRHGIYLLRFLTDSTDPYVRQKLLQAIGELRDSSLVRELILASIHFRPQERRQIEDAIGKMGLRAVPTLLTMTKDPRLHDKCRVLSGRILGRLALPQLRANLYDIISIEINRAYFYFYHSFDTNRQWENLPILKDALASGFHSVIDFIIQLLGVAGSIEKSELLSHALRSRNPKTRSHAVETLEKTCESKIFRLLKPLIDDRPVEDKLKLYLKENHPALSFEELLDALDTSSSPADHVIALTLKAKHNFPNWRASLRKHMEKDEEIFHHFAYELLEV